MPGLLFLKAGIVPVVVEGHCLVDSHGIDELASLSVPRGPETDDPISYFRTSSDARLAGSEGAIAVEWVGGETGVVGNDVNVYAHGG